MIAFAFSFPAGRYHATHWGRHTNEADVAWPPEPVRILRSLIATWWRKADHSRFPKEKLDDLVDALAAELPVYNLPPAVHAQLRAYMPAPADRRLIYDAFLRFDRDAELVIAWPGVTLPTEQKELCSYLLDQIGYLGRAESWTIARVADDWAGEFNSCPRSPDHTSNTDVPVDVVVPLTPAKWAGLRLRLLSSIARMTKAKRGALEATLRERLSDALSVDSSEWQKAGWSSPPPICKRVYDRPPVGPLPLFSVTGKVVAAGQLGRPEVARFVLAGRPQPRIEQGLRIGELARAALMSGGGNPPLEFSGRNADGPQRDDPGHGHSFFLPEDADDDGDIDHLIVFCRHGFSIEARRRLDLLHRLWLADGRADGEEERGSKEWRLALEDIATPQDFAAVSALLRRSRTWISVTPYLMPWHSKRNFGATEQIKREIARRGNYPALANVAVLDQKHAIKFQRIRSRRGLVQPDRLGCFMKITFAEPTDGPLALGFGCHYGLGLFRPGEQSTR